MRYLLNPDSSDRLQPYRLAAELGVLLGTLYVLMVR
jgi:hypothetical protein